MTIKKEQKTFQSQRANRWISLFFYHPLACAFKSISNMFVLSLSLKSTCMHAPWAGREHAMMKKKKYKTIAESCLKTNWNAALKRRTRASWLIDSIVYEFRRLIMNTIACLKGGKKCSKRKYDKLLEPLSDDFVESWQEKTWFVIIQSFEGGTIKNIY